MSITLTEADQIRRRLHGDSAQGLMFLNALNEAGAFESKDQDDKPRNISADSSFANGDRQFSERYPGVTK